MKPLEVLYTVMFLLFFGGTAFGDECSCAHSAQGNDLVIEESSVSGQPVTMRFESNPITKNTKVGFICTLNPSAILAAKLWMPDHGHGSGPTKIVPVSPICTRIEKIGFVMPGKWEIQVSISSADAVTFSVHVENPS